MERAPRGAEEREGPEPARAGERVRAAARDLFYRRGVRAVGVEEIVERAGVTKPSLYRGFASKDALVVACLEDYDTVLRGRLEDALAAHPGDHRAGLLTFLAALAERSATPSFRGCGLTNTLVEYPDPDHPARRAVLASKRALRARLAEIAGAIGARDADALGDGLLMLVEGAFACGQIFGPGGPPGALTGAAEALIAASVAPRAP
ncbi:hypothetical protein OPKNFCMD_0326 [Methylobacterium crusticola]|uniref:HTH tetR-type domain-containing protein n=1 Tax=Methylobacterium crusticola TaxID=1697972 RepID=A0ABQ4QQP6_9HYPH|nr:TetR/AcrR family transcriptional regulator [Methylobacterium crusticola]GJD47618.1 hypothetical protein OPKNFCMD_0326 [Methylobacterium crusticola]